MCKGERGSVKLAALLAAGVCLGVMVSTVPPAEAGGMGYGTPYGSQPGRQPQQQPAPQPVQTEDSGAPPPAAAAPGEGDTAEPVRLLTAEIPPLRGPKRTIAVGKFDAIGAFTAKYGDWDIGGGLAAMLTSALVESERFIVLERANVGQILSEQEFKAAGVANPETGPALGKLTGSQLLIYGAVTEFGTDDSGGGLSVGVSGGGLGRLLSGALSRQSVSGKVAMDIRLVDTTTGQVLENYRVSEDLSSTGYDVSVGYENVSLGTNKFWKTPLGEATRKAINNAVQWIVLEAQKKPWVGRVVDAEGQDLYINAGTQAGLSVGDQFMIERVVKRFTDPETGEVLGSRKTEIGVLKLTGIESKLAFGAFQPLGAEPPRRGDLVVIMK
jgi:curli biogenesis system outer membrane secretion channel CsgG